MQVKDVMSKEIISVKPEDNISSAFSKMKKNGLHQLLVMNENELFGIVELKKLVSRDVDPNNTKIYGFVTHVSSIDANSSIESAVSLLLKSGVRALPVTDAGNVVGVVSESDIIKDARELRFSNIAIAEMLAPAICIDKNTTIAKARRIMLDNNISRLPVLENGKVIGVFGSLDIIKVMEGREKMPSRGGRLQEKGAKEKLRTEEATVSSFMHTAPILESNANLNQIIEHLSSNDEVLINSGDNVCIVTPKDVMEIFSARPQKQVYVQITGMQNESIEFKVKMDSEISSFVKKISKMGEIQHFFVHVNKVEKGGKHDLYQIRARLKMPFGFFVAEASGWKPLQVVQEIITKLEREIIKKRGKKEDSSRMRHIKDKYV